MHAIAFTRNYFRNSNLGAGLHTLISMSIDPVALPFMAPYSQRYDGTTERERSVLHPLSS